MKPNFKSAALLIGLTAPLHISAQHHRHGGKGGVVVVEGGTVIVTEYLTVTGTPGVPGANTNKVLVLSTSTPLETIKPGETPSIADTPLPGTTSTQSPSTFDESPTQTQTQTSSSSSLTESPVPTSAPQSSENANGGTDGSLTISITNSYGAPLSLALGSNYGGPQPDGNPEPTTIATTASYTFPSGWAGRISVGKSLSGPNSLIEASFGNGPCAIDVSYVDAYSVPITCSVGGSAVTGCNIELFNQGIACDLPAQNGDLCINSSAHKDDGPPPAFFAACEGAAYTFPNDNTATNGGVEGRLISCCIGTSCPSPPQQQSSGKKRSLAARDGRAVKRHLHGHQQRHGKRSLRNHVHQLAKGRK